MDEARARRLLETMLAWDQVPALTTDEVDDLVVIAKRIDASGLAPDAADWTETWDLNSAAAEGWRWKAAKVAGSFDFVTDSQRFDRSQIAAMCLDMADRYRRRVLSSPRVGSGLPIIPAPVVLSPTLGELLP